MGFAISALPAGVLKFTTLKCQPSSIAEGGPALAAASHERLLASRCRLVLVACVTDFSARKVVSAKRNRTTGVTARPVGSAPQQTPQPG